MLHPFIGIQNTNPLHGLVITFSLSNPTKFEKFHVGDDKAEWIKVKDINEAEQIVFEKSEEHSFGKDDFLDFCKNGRILDSRIHWLKSHSSRLAGENRRGCPKFYVGRKETYNFLKYDSRDIVRNTLKEMPDCAGYKCVGCYDNDFFLFLVNEQVKENHIHLFYKGSEMDAGFYYTNDEEGQQWLCLPKQIDYGNNIKTLSGWFGYTKTLKFEI
jgi:hypothetical protein